MAIRKRVSCINKRGDHYNAHERIEKIGGIDNGKDWKVLESSAIFNIKFRIEEYYVLVGSKPVNIIIGIHNNREYLKTTDDDYASNNLLNLPECAPYLGL